ncbi:MAG: GNAT family N-acetyltransferase [Erysipelotrichaceae bacterium]|nr:GNAT family N-acetyltransferase [Erysipelotrichaceae bacterium]
MSDYVLKRINEDMYEKIAAFRKEMLKAGSSFDGCVQLQDYEDIEKWDLNNKLFENFETCPPGYSLGFVYAYMKDDELVGMVNIRPLAETHVYLKEYGGHIGYAVRPSYRNKGVAKQMLRDTLKICKEEFGLDRVMITCLEDNIASQKVIISNGGVFEKEVYYPPENKNLKRYWIRL